MRLVTIEVDGFRRFRRRERMVRLEIDGPLVAIIGPNEAGKTSLLRALCRLDDDDPISVNDRTRLAGIVDSHQVLEALYLIEEKDRDVLKGLHSADDATLTRWFVVRKHADGTRRYELLPGLSRDKATRVSAAAALKRLRAHRGWPASGAEEDEDLSSASFDEALQALEESAEEISPPGRSAIGKLLSGLRDAEFVDKQLATLASHALEELVAAERRESEQHPNDEAIARLMDRRPHFLFFGDQERDLRTDYVLSEVVASPPPALDNLARLAGLDLAFLHNLVSDGDTGTAVDVLEQANRRLREAFEAWSQATTRVRFDREGDAVLRLHVSREGGGYDRLDDRSDGLRIFVSLLAVTARTNFHIPPIVLVDELERHLHYDAQADVVQLFARQTEIPQIVYTTHSAGCLPEDIGAGIRIVHRVEGTNDSGVRNRFWTTQGDTANIGFSPLLFGMGASTLAFVPVRNAVLTEGAADLILLPTLVREATGAKHVGFQVAPASSEAPPAHVAGLSREAVRVMWLVDGDSAGGRLAREVRRQLGAERVAQIGGAGSGKVLEDLLRPSVYARAINAQFERSGIAERISVGDLDRVNRPRLLKTWCEQRNIAVPNKADVAYRVLDLKSDIPALLSADGSRLVMALVGQLQASFGEAPGQP
ncbi:MAG: AAA family ATPase [Gaiellales bacterium]